MKKNNATKAISVFVTFLVALTTILGVSTAAAQEGSPNNVVQVTIKSSSITWAPLVSSIKGMTLTITGANGFYDRKQSKENTRLTVSSGAFGDGVYDYEVVLSSPASQDSGDPSTRGLNSQSASSMTQSGTFTVLGGSFVTAGSEPGPLDSVVADDGIFQGSLCVGFDCVNNESFGFDTLRLKENNTRIGFDDTSVGAFPSNDWTIVANDSASGGANYLGFEDVTGGKFPFKVTAGAPTNSLFVASNGKLGLGTGTPVLNIHTVSSDTPAMRLEQNGSGGFTPQTWDIAGNEANFFIRDVTGGSRLPFRIRPGAPTSSIDIAASGNVGIGTASPSYDLDVANTGANTSLAVRRTDGVTTALGATNSAGTIGTANNFPLEFQVNNTSKMFLTTTGKLGIGTVSPTFDIDVEGTGANTGMSLVRTDGASLMLLSSINRGIVGTQNDFPLQFRVNNIPKMTLAQDGTLTVLGNVEGTVFVFTSDKNAKENFSPIDRASVLERLSAMPISTWNFIENDNKTKHMGPMAQDFYAAFGLGADDKHISAVDSMGVAFAAIQELNSENTSLRGQVDSLTQRISAMESGAPAQQQNGMNFLIALLVCMNLGLVATLIWSAKRSKVMNK